MAKKLDLAVIKQQAKLELARREFFYFCHLLAPDFYKRDRGYLKVLDVYKRQAVLLLPCLGGRL